MHRFHLQPEHCNQLPLTLTGREAHHALQVLRFRKGNRLAVLDGVGHEWTCEVQSHNRDQVCLAVIESKFTPPLSYRITLLQAIPKGKIIESIIQKGTELGVSRIVPLLSERTAIHLGREDASTRANKWRLTAIEALKQCGNPWLPQIEAPLTPATFLARREPIDLALIASLQPDSRHPRQHLQAFLRAHGGTPHTVCIWVGPEGDFTPGEIAAIQAAGAMPVTLGPLVLRSETAAIYCLSMLSYELTADQKRATDWS
jgi:16S rRNA (uracil1498-N3)-methyltransferase